MKKRLACMLWVIVALSACSVEEKDIKDATRHAWSYADEAVRGEPYEPVRSNKPEVFVDSKGIFWNGTYLRHGSPLQQWLNVLGQPDRRSKDGYILVWDALGIRVVAREPEFYTPQVMSAGELFVSLIELYTQPKPPEVPADVPLPASTEPADTPEPNGVFPGYIRFDNFGIDGKTTEQDIMRFNRRDERPYRYHCVNGARRRCEAIRKISSRLPPEGMREYTLFRVRFYFNEANGSTVEAVDFGIDGYESPSFEPEIEKF